MPLPEPVQVAATRRFQAQLEAIRARAATVAEGAFEGLGRYDEVDITRFRDAAGPVMDAAKTASVDLSNGYYSLVAEAPPAPVTADLVPVEMAWREPFISVWRGLSVGTLWADAVTSGVSRAGAAASNFVTSSSRRTGDLVADAGIVGWRRVLTGTSCEWCRLVSTQRYRTAESADFGHDSCDCGAAPIFGDADPGRVINRRLLDEVNRLAATAS